MPNVQAIPIRCTGGCERTLPVGDMVTTPDGLMCNSCFCDLHTFCTECGCALRFDAWGECDDLTRGPDNLDRCIACDQRIFSRCVGCGRRVRREDDIIRTDPEHSDDEYCHTCWDNNWFTCEECGDIYRRREMYCSPDSNQYCEQCFSRRYFCCPVCGCSFLHRDMHNWDGDPHCESCMGNADTWKVRPWGGEATSFKRIGSKRCFGVELETNHCSNYHNLHGRTVWGCVYECSTPGREFISPILQGDEGLAEIQAMCDIAEQKHWTVNTSCGLHIHSDARDLTSNQCLQVAYAYRKTYPMWKKFVSRGRSDNSMCGSPQYNCEDIRAAEHFEDFAESRDRFEFVNWRSYLCHGSIEVRLYQGTLSAREICNWVILHLRFIDAVKDMTFDELDKCFGCIARNNWKGLVKIIDDPKLLDYWRRKAKRRHNALAVLWDDDTPIDISDDSLWETRDYNEDNEDTETSTNPIAEAVFNLAASARQRIPPRPEAGRAR